MSFEHNYLLPNLKRSDVQRTPFIAAFRAAIVASLSFSRPPAGLLLKELEFPTNGFASV